MEVMGDTSKIEKVWRPVDGTDKYYLGQLTKTAASGTGGDGVVVATTAVGTGDTSNKQMLEGVINGFNDVTPTYEDGSDVTGFNGQELEGVVTQTDVNARNWFGQEGMWSKGDPSPMAEIFLIDSTTWIKAPLYATNYGTAPVLLTSTAGNANGLTVTTNACDFTPISNGRQTIYARTGANATQYRVTDDNSNVVATWDRAMRATTATTGETYVRVPLQQGWSFMNIDTEGLYVEVDDTPDANYFLVYVRELNLKEAGREYVVFRFSTIHFDELRA